MIYPVYRPSLMGNEKKYVNECLDSTWISSKGNFINSFENEFSRFIKSKYATSVCNGTTALHLASVSLGLSSGDEIICPSFTYVASINPFAQSGCRIVFCDSLEDSWQMNPDHIENLITQHTRAIIAAHIYGHPCDMDRIYNICHKYGLYLIEDCAESLGSYYKNKHTGTFGNISCFSFFGNKTITCGEGGMITTDNYELYKKSYHLKTQGVVAWKEYWHDISAYNYRMTNIQAAIGLAQLEQVEIFLKKKQQIADWYRTQLKNLPLVFHNPIGDVRHSYWMVSVLAETLEVRSKLREYLKTKGIETRPTFPCVHTMPMYNKRFLYLPVAEDLSSRGINLPSYPDLTENDVTFICDEIRAFYG